MRDEMKFRPPLRQRALVWVGRMACAGCTGDSAKPAIRATMAVGLILSLPVDDSDPLHSCIRGKGRGAR